MDPPQPDANCEARSGTRARAAWICIALTTACLGHQRSAAPPEPAVDRVAGLDPFALSDVVSRELVLEVDWVEGRPPDPGASSLAADRLREVAAPGRRVSIVLDDTIPRVEWDVARRDRSGLGTLVERHLDGDPRGWAERELIYVLYVPSSEPWYAMEVTGMADTLALERDGVVRLVLLFTDSIDSRALLWIGRGDVERAVLVHELGHQLGLVSNPSHVQRDHPWHCTQSRCVMNQPGIGALLANSLPALLTGSVPTDYCRRCRADLREAREAWNAAALTDPHFGSRLAARRRIEELDAARRRAQGVPPPAGPVSALPRLP